MTAVAAKLLRAKAVAGPIRDYPWSCSDPGALIGLLQTALERHNLHFALGLRNG